MTDELGKRITKLRESIAISEDLAQQSADAITQLLKRVAELEQQLAEARQEIEELKQKHVTELKYFGDLHRKEYDRISQRAEAAEQQLAKARAQIAELESFFETYAAVIERAAEEKK